MSLAWFPRPVTVAMSLVLGLAACGGSPAGSSQEETTPSTSEAAAAVFPEEGKTIRLIISSAAGSGADISFRTITPYAEAALGVPFEIINIGGAGTQLGAQALAIANPDGYTIGATPLPTTIGVYLDKEREAAFDGSSFEPIFMHIFDPGAIVVDADSPYQTLDDLISAAKASPGTIKMGSGGHLTRQHLDVLQLQDAADVEFALVQASSDDDPIALLLGGHIDVMQESIGDFTSLLEGGEVRVLGLWDKERSERYPDIPTMAEQGYELYSGVSRGISAPGGTPPEIVQVLADAFKEAYDDPGHQEKLQALGFVGRWLGPEDYRAYWDSEEVRIAALLELAATFE